MPSKQRTLAAFLLLTTTSAILGVADANAGDAGSAKVEMSIVVNGDWIVGLPLWVALTVTTPPSRGVSIGRKRPYPFVAPTYRYELLQDGVVSNTSGEVTGGYAHDAEVVYIGTEASMRMLFPIETESFPPPGTYELRVYLLSGLGGTELAEAAITNITIRSATREEQAAIDVLGLRPWWFWFDRGRREELRSLRIPESLRHAVGFDLLLRRLLDSGDCEEYRRCDLGLRDLQPGDVSMDGVADFFAPEVAAIRHELLRSKRRNDEASTLKRETIESYPGIAWLFELPPGARPLMKGRGLQRHVQDRLYRERAR